MNMHYTLKYICTHSDTPTYYLFSASSSGGFTYHQSTPTVTKKAINVIKDTSLVASQILSTTATRAMIQAHGILMIIAWPIFAGLAIYFPAYLKPFLSNKGEWFQVSTFILNIDVKAFFPSLLLSYIEGLF